MNVFELQASIGLDINQFESGIKRAKALMEDFRKVSTKITSVYDSAVDKMADSMEDASENIGESLEDVTKEQKKAGKAAEDMGKDTEKAADKSEKSSQKIKGNWKDVGQSFVSMGKLAAKGLAVLSGAVTAAGGALLALDGTTEDYRIAQGKLNTAFEVAGQTTETASSVFREFYKILGDTDTSTEASQLLAKLALTQEDYATWTNIAAGVNGTFGDSLPIEGLIESANETARVGQVTGVLADALNWASISEDDFNEKLKECSTEEERNRLIMETLSEEYKDAASAFYENNNALMANRDAQIRVTDALSKVGGAVSSIKGELLERFAPAIEEVTGKLADFISKIDIDKVISNVSAAIQEAVKWWEKWGPLVVGVATTLATLTIVNKVVSFITTLVGAMTSAGSVMGLLGTAVTALGGPIAIIIAAIAGLVAGIVYLWNTNEDFRNKVVEIWEGIKQAFSDAVTDIGQWMTNMGQSISDAFNNAVEAAGNAVNSIVEWFSALPSRVSEFLNGLKESASQLWSNMTITLGEKWNNFMSTLNNAWSDFVSSITTSELWSNFTQSMSDLYESAKEIWDNVVSTVQNAVQKLKDAMNFEWSLPHIKLPHFSISGKFSLDPPSVPSFNVSWYRKAMNNAMILNGATIFGAMNGQLLGGGEAGKEVVSGADTLMNMIRDAVRDVIHSGKNTSGIQIIQNIQTVPQTPVELAALTQSYFEQARWAI